MANVKNFGLVGVGTDVQYGKAGSRLINNAGTFNFKAANGTTDTALTAAGITSSAGNVTLTTGNLVLTDVAGILSIGSDTSVSRYAAGVAKFNGSAAFMAPVGNTAARPSGATGMVRVNNDTTNATVEYFNGTAWSTLATGGDATALQTEVDNIEATLGTLVNTDGTTNVAAALTNTLFGGANDLTTALTNLAAGVQGKDTLDEIFPSTAAGNIIYSNGSNVWTQGAAGATSGVQAYDLGLTNLAAKSSTGIMIQTGADTYGSASLVAPVAGLTITNPDGVAGDPIFALANDLAALEGLAGTGFAVRSAADTWVQRSLVAPAAGFAITNADGVAGNPTFALANDLAALEGLTTIGYMVRTGDGTATTRSLGVISTDLAITGSADGVSTDTTFGLAEVTQAATGDFVKVTLDSKGRVVGNTAVTTADITALVDATYVNVSGDTMLGNLSFGDAFKVINLAEPTNPQDAATKNYVDNAVTGLTWKNAVVVMSTANVPVAAPAAGVDGVTLTAGDRVLLVNQTTASENGIWVFNGAAVPMTRPADANAYTELNGASVFVTDGTFADSAWVQTTTLTSFTGQTWTQFSGAGAYAGGTGITVSGTTISANLGAGITDLPTGEIGADVEAGKAIQLTNLLTGGQLTFMLDGAGLEQSAAGLKISAAGVTNAMLAHSQFTINGDSGTDALVLGDTLQIKGTSTQGISTIVTESPVGTSTFTLTAADASASQKGVATFDAVEFTVTSGNVVLGTIGNSKLANSTVTFTGTAGSDAVALGESMAIIGADSAITTSMGANSLSIQLNTVDVAHGGTGATSFASNQVLFGNGTAAIQSDAAFTFTPTGLNGTLAIGGANGATLATNGLDTTLTSLATNSDIVLMPNGTGAVVVGPVGAGLIQSDTGTALTVRGNTVLTLASVTGSTVMSLPSGTGSKVTISGPSAADYATGLAAADLVNKQYVDTSIATGAVSGSIKAVKATVALNANGSTNIGAIMPAGATVLSVKVDVDVVDTTATLTIGKSGAVAVYMDTAENDPQSLGLYVSEAYVTESTAVQVVATVAGSSATGAGSCRVIVQYQVA